MVFTVGAGQPGKRHAMRARGGGGDKAIIPHTTAVVFLCHAIRPTGYCCRCCVGAADGLEVLRSQSIYILSVFGSGTYIRHSGNGWSVWRHYQA